MADDLFSQSSLKILRPKSLEMLGLMLNARKLFTTDDGKLRDYRGLAEQAGLTPAMLKRVESTPEHVREIISLWCRESEVASVQTLVDALESIDRVDAIDDARDLLLVDCVAAHEKGLDSVAVVRTNECLTMQDMEAIRKGEPLTKYNAIVLHGEDADDETLAWHLTERLEAAGKKVFLPQRDLVAGTIEHAASAQIIEKRCDRAVIIFSPSFLNSSLNKLYTDLAQFVGLQRQRAVIIPVMFKRCENLPANLSMITKLCFDPKKGSRMTNFYERLFKPFDIDTRSLSKELLTYPDGIPSFMPNGFQPQAIPQQVHKNRESSTTPSVSSSIFYKDLDSVATTFSEMSSCSSDIDDRLPEVPVHEPSSGDSASYQQKSPRKKIKNPLKAMKKVFSNKSKKLAYLES